MSDRRYDYVWYRLDDVNGYLIWFTDATDDIDGFVCGPDGLVPAFHSEEELFAYAAAHGIKITPRELVLDDLDMVAEWVEHEDQLPIDHPLQRDRGLLGECWDAWGLFWDISVTVNGNFDPFNSVYGKFLMNEQWNQDELDELRGKLRTGPELFRRHVALTPHSRA
jgi:hypothetical protein